jgi:hypothetical protein
MCWECKVKSKDERPYMFKVGNSREFCGWET